MSDLLEPFLAEGRELVRQAEAELLALERAPGDRARLDGAFRAVHTLKGSVALFDLAPMGRALHAGEDLLDALRAGRIGIGPGVVDALLGLVGACEAWIEAVAAAGTLPEGAEARGRALEAALRAPIGEGPAPAAGPAPEGEPGGADWATALLAAEAGRLGALAGRRLTALRYRPAPDCFFLGDDPLAFVRAAPGLAALRLAPLGPVRPEEMDPFACHLTIELLSTAEEPALRAAFRTVPDQVLTATVEVPAAPVAGARALRVEAARVDALLDLAGEMMVAANGLGHLVDGLEGGGAAARRALAEGRAGLSGLAEAMHRAVLALRLVPMGRVFSRLPRLVRETAAASGKTVALEIRGEAVEADRAVVDGLFDPLLHLLRNAVDHGIEAPEARRAAGKPEAGRITLSARQEGGGIVVEVSDDGGGIDPGRVRQAAAARGLMPPAALAALDDRAAVELVFRPGFSTAPAVTALSGRGVGMDAVRAAVEALGGRVSLRGAPGRGTAARLVLPGGAAVASVLLLRLGAEVFGVPMEAAEGTARIPAARIRPLGAGEAFVWRDRTLPLLRLAALLGLPGGERGAERGDMARVLLLPEAGIEVDGFAGRAELLLRPPGGLLGGVPGLIGTALLGDGRVLPVLDLPRLIGSLIGSLTGGLIGTMRPGGEG